MALYKERGGRGGEEEEEEEAAVAANFQYIENIGCDSYISKMTATTGH